MQTTTSLAWIFFPGSLRMRADNTAERGYHLQVRLRNPAYHPLECFLEPLAVDPASLDRPVPLGAKLGSQLLHLGFGGCSGKSGHPLVLSAFNLFERRIERLFEIQ